MIDISWSTWIEIGTYFKNKFSRQYCAVIENLNREEKKNKKINMLIDSDNRSGRGGSYIMLSSKNVFLSEDTILNP